MPEKKRSVTFNATVKEAYYRRIPSYDRFPSDGVECPLGMELKHCYNAKRPLRSKSPTKPRCFRIIPCAGLKKRRKLLGLTPRPEETQHSKKSEKLKRKREEEFESQLLEGEEGEEEPKKEREEKAKGTEMAETSEEGGEGEPKVNRRTSRRKKKLEKEGDVELKREDEEDNQAHILDKTEDDDEEDGEKELRAILASRQWSGCSCKGRCREETCECLQAGIHCRHTDFRGGRSSCACSKKRCNNIDPSLRGSKRRKQEHFRRVMTRVLMEEWFGNEE